ncbi:GntR family transcriptional regulator [Pseudonocardia sp. HH130630-07]|nr:GntR family transcriptional regulator [Pseudonocardia sp. HH130630-07]
MINNGAQPKHEQLRHLLAGQIADRYSPGDPFPSERQLCQDHGLSRVTVRAAIGQLERDGLLSRVRGKGTYVAARTARSRLHLASFHDDMRRLGLAPTTVVLELESAVPPAGTLAALSVRSDQVCTRVRRLRLADGAPMSVDDAWYNGALAPDLAERDLSGSLYELLRAEYDLPIDSAEQTVAAREVDAVYGVLLGIPVRHPILEFDRISFSRGRPVEHSISRYRGDRYELFVELDDTQT